MACGALAVIAPCVPDCALAADYPAKPIRVVVPFAAGATDIQARFVLERAQARVGQPFIVEPRGGAGTVIGSDVVAKAAPDGYTLLFTSGVLATLKPLNKQLPFDPDRAFVPISLVSQGFFAVGISSAVPARTFGEFVAYAKANPGKLNYVSLGRNSVMLMVESLKHAAGFDAVPIAYQGMAQGRVALARNDVQLILDSPSDERPFIEAGQVRLVMMAGPARSPNAPDVPTAAEAGLPGYQASYWTGLLAPAGTARAVVDQLSTAVMAAARLPEVQKFYRDQNSEAVGSTPEEFSQRIQADSRRYVEAARVANIQPE